ncbi:hypothetical protein GTQ48_07385 [Alteromonas genovensis]|uniref:Uncharacterized protein n=1 Tax=Alteromonas genovensis TaxID=471225 RepID=A0A6N9TKZ0_9ALTE|nr:hypothetical protein [Alteromonas genovensis]NDW15338.1 hypothetical protein [Alteromonas genovensis]
MKEFFNTLLKRQFDVAMSNRIRRERDTPVVDLEIEASGFQVNFRSLVDNKTVNTQARKLLESSASDKAPRVI